MRFQRERRGVSEVVGIMVMLAVVVSLGVLVFALASGGMGSLSQGYATAMKGKADALSEKFAVEQVTFTLGPAVVQSNYVSNCNSINCGGTFSSVTSGDILTFGLGWSGQSPPSTPADTLGSVFTLGVSKWGYGSPTSSSPLTIGTSTTNAATYYPIESKVFFCQTRYWAFYTDGTSIVFRTSTDGITWTSTTTVRAGTIGYDFSAWVDCANTKVYYVWSSEGTTMTHRAGTLNTGGTITWDGSSEATITSTYGTNTDPTITKDTSGILWIATNTLHTTATVGNYVEVWKCTISGTNCETASNWSDSTNILATSESTSDGVGPIIRPLTSGKLSLTYGKGVSASYTGVQGIRTYSGATWSSETTTTSSYLNGGTSGVAIADTTYFAGITSTGTILYWSCAYPCSSTPTETTISSATTNVQVQISSDNSQQLLVLYGTGGSSSSILYEYSTNGGTSWSGQQTLASSESVRAYSLTGSVTTGNGNFQILWTSNTSTYNVRFATISFPTSYSYIWYATAASTGADTMTATFSSAVTGSVSLYEISGATTIGYQSSTGSDVGSTTASVTSFTPASNSLVIGNAETASNTFTAGTGYTLVGTCNSVYGCGEYQTGVGTATTVPFTLGSSAPWVESAISFGPTQGADVYVRNVGTISTTLVSVYVTDQTTNTFVSAFTMSTAVNVGTFADIRYTTLTFAVTHGHTYSFIVTTSLGNSVIYNAKAA